MEPVSWQQSLISTSLSTNNATHAPDMSDTCPSRPCSLIEAESILPQQAAALAESASTSFTKPALSSHYKVPAALDAVTDSLKSPSIADMPGLLPSLGEKLLVQDLITEADENVQRQSRDFHVPRKVQPRMQQQQQQHLWVAGALL